MPKISMPGLNFSNVVSRSWRGIQSYFLALIRQVKSRVPSWRRLFTISILASLIYVFMEWLFFVTMPSFMSLMDFWARMKIFLLTGWGLSVFCIAAILAYIALDILCSAIRCSIITRYLGWIIPTAIISSLILLLVDNFTYTVFGFGVSTSSGMTRGIYTLFFILLVGLVYFQLLRTSRKRETEYPARHRLDTSFFFAVGLLVVTTGLALSSANYESVLPKQNGQPARAAQQLPNIILLGSDGLNANHLSVYGYYRDTTPRLKELAESSLVAQNAFTNAGNSAGSVISIMTSKLPTQTRVLYPPDILTGINSYQHLPGILSNLGYQSYEFGVPYYIDAFNYNLQDGFDYVNDRSVPVGALVDLGQKLGFENEAYFLTRLVWRISDRLMHIFFIHEMQNPYYFVIQPAPVVSDEAKIDRALAVLDQAQAPVFVHIHLLGTHGGYYSPQERIYSKGESQAAPWLTDFYDDTLVGFDSMLGKVIDQLNANGQFDNTILIIYSDHNKEFKVDERIPLIIHLPKGVNAGLIQENVENMDIAPTVLDYLGIAKPGWMEGSSMLNLDTKERRLIFSMGTSKVKPNELEISFIDPSMNKPPFYQFSYINVLDCQRMYSFDLTTYQWSSKDVAGYVQPCRVNELLTPQQIRQAVYQRLEQDGFDISSLP